MSVLSVHLSVLPYKLLTRICKGAEKSKVVGMFTRAIVTVVLMFGSIGPKLWIGLSRVQC